MSQQINSNEQLVQTLAALNNCVANHQLQQHQQVQKQQMVSHSLQNVSQKQGRTKKKNNIF